MSGDARLPVHVVTGFLGAGKTSLLRRLLVLPELGDTAVIVNEFGEVGLDHLLVEEVLAEDVVLLRSGCVCCSVRGDLKAALVALMERRRRREIPAFARVAVETTGIADPGPITATLIADPMLRHHVRMGGIVTVVDVPNGLSNLDAFPEAPAQVAAADRIVVTKTDLASAADTARLSARLSAINPAAAILPLSEDVVPDAGLLLADTHDDSARAAEASRWLAAAESAARPNAFQPDSHPDIASFVLRAREPIAWPRFALWLSMLLNRHGANVLRLKGVLDLEGVESPVVIQGVQHQIHAPLHLSRWPGPRETTLVVIAKGLDPALVERSFAAFVLASGRTARPGSASLERAQSHMRFAVFDDLKSKTTLLIWADVGSDLAPLVDSLDELAQGSRSTVRLDASLGATAVGGTQVSIETASREAVVLRGSREGPIVELHCSRERCGELADQLRSFTTPPDQAGHHYLDLTADQPLQIIVSAGEYPPGLEP